MRFQDRVVIVTGGAKGIGRGCVEAFANEGAKVAIFDLDEAAARDLAYSLEDVPPGHLGFWKVDVADAEAFPRAIAQVVEQWGRLDCLVNNAGVHPPAMTIEETTPEEVERVLRINFLSTFIGSRAAVPHLRKTRGSIVNMSSMTAVLGQTHSTAYAASKAAQVAFTKSLALELGPDNVRVNAILPSNVDTPLMREWADTLPDPDEALERVANLQVFNRMAEPIEIGRVALFLATSDASFLTGQAIEADGGAALDY